MSAVVKMELGNVPMTKEESFNLVMESIKPMMTEGKGRNMRTITGTVCVPLSLCFVDERYQGFRMHKRINRLSNNWNIRKLTPITLVPHPEENRFAIVDGQGRFLVAPTKGMNNLWATVLLDAPEDPEERLKFEAEQFASQNSEVENLKPVEKHLAKVITGDKAAVILDKMLDKYHLEVLISKGHRGYSVLGSYTDTYSIAKVHGEECLEFIFSIIKNAGWDKEVNGYATFVMRSLRDVWVAHPDYRGKIYEFLSKEFRKIDPKLFSSFAKTKYPKRDHRVSCVLYTEDLVCSGLKIEKKIYIDGEKKCKIIK